MTLEINTRSAFETLRRLAPVNLSVEHCELCSLALGSAHQHLFAIGNRKIVCACEACAVLFSDARARKFKRIPRGSRRFADFALDDMQWDALRVPIGLAFFFYESDSARSPSVSAGSTAPRALPDGRASDTSCIKAFYPSPAGATESLLDLSAWKEIESANPLLARMDSDVEALLVNRIGNTRDYYITPIDQCYRLVGLIRTNWRGLSGGAEVWIKVEEFFRELRS
jgi:hypothetical protein